MDESWVTFILIGLTASFMPLILSMEIYVLGADDGTKKVSSLLGGVTLFRLLVTLLAILLFAGMMASLKQELSDIGQFLGSLLTQIDTDITSGQHLFIDLLLIAAGLSLIVQAIRHLRGGSQANQTDDAGNSKAMDVGIAGMIGMGIMMTATNVQQWLLVSAGVNQILRTEFYHWSGLLAFLLFLLLATSFILLPLGLYLVSPDKAGVYLQRLNGWINGSMRYVVAGLLALVGLYLIWKGGVGVLNFLPV
jgi:threonine/homoserine/homoserine lactone efflux protein